MNIQEVDICIDIYLQKFLYAKLHFDTILYF